MFKKGEPLVVTTGSNERVTTVKRTYPFDEPVFIGKLEEQVLLENLRNDASSKNRVLEKLVYFNRK